MQRRTERHDRHRRWLGLWCLISVVTLCSLVPASAQELNLSVRTQTPKLRSQAPVPLALTLNWNTTDLLEGTLSLEIREGAELIMKYENADLAMIAGDNSLRIMLPPFDLETDEIEIKGRFSSLEWGLFDLGQHTVKVVPDWTRQFLVALVVPNGDRSPRAAYAYVDDFQLTRFQPQAERTGHLANEMQSVDARIDADEFPTGAANLCAFDVVFVTQGALEDLRSGERKALRQWVDSGGSVFIDASGPVNIEETDYLNELASRTRGENAFLPGSNGKLPPGQLAQARYGLGRVVVSTTPASELTSRQTSASSRWLWKVTRAASSAIEANGTWKALTSDQRNRKVSYSTGFGAAPGAQPDLPDTQVSVGFPPYAPLSADFAPELPTSLLPATVRTVPLPVVVSLLSLFLLIVAPGDWYILGKLKRRMLTWVLFPGMCVLFGGILILLARSYVGSEDYRTAMRLVDWGAADRISRVSSVETLFTASTKPVKVRLGNELYSSVEVRAIQWTSSGAGGVTTGAETQDAAAAQDAAADEGDEQKRGPVTYYRSGRKNEVVMGDFGISESDPGDEDRDRNIPRIIGRPPGAYFVETDVDQWTPFVARTTGFFREPKDEYQIDWADADFAAIAEDPNAIVKNLRDANSDSLVCVLHQEELVGLGDNPAGWERVTRFLRLAASSSADQSRALFNVISRLSPNGHGSLEDLQLFDKTNPDEALILIAKADGANVIIHRRLFYKDETTPTKQQP